MTITSPPSSAIAVRGLTKSYKNVRCAARS